MNRLPDAPSPASSPWPCGYNKRNNISPGRGGDITTSKVSGKFGLIGLVVASLVTLLTTPLAVAALGDQLAKLTPSDAEAFDRFGQSVAISARTAIIGAHRDDDNGNNSGSAYLFDVTTGLQLSKLTPSDGAEFDNFGHSVGISGKTAVVGAPRDGSGSGRAYAFDITTGNELAKLTPSDSTSGDRFGTSIGISGNTAIVGAPHQTFMASHNGSAYLFDIATGSQLAKLTPSDGAVGDAFGYSVGISGSVAIVGAYQDDDMGENSGSAYLFDVTTGAQLAKLTASDGTPGEWFGFSVAISGNTAIVGAYWGKSNGSSSGSAYLFDVPTGVQIAKLSPNDGASFDNFGVSVGVSGNTAIIGASGDDDNGTDSGSAYLFDIVSGLQLAKLTPSDGAQLAHYGSTVGIGGNKAVVGAGAHDNIGIDSGSAYLFDVTIPEPSTLLLIAWASAGVLGWKRQPGVRLER